MERRRTDPGRVGSSGLALLWLLAAPALVAPVRAEMRAAEATGQLPAPAASPPSAARPDFGFERLPPGIRTHADRARLAWERDSKASHSRYVLEIVESPGDRVGSPAWFEVEYTVDPDLDERVAELLDDMGVALGHVILMDPASGEVFSYVSTDPEKFPATRAYPTASLMKVVTAAGVLRRAPQAASRPCRYVGSPYELRRALLDPPRSGGSAASFWRALAISNNQCFAHLAVHDLGEQALLAEIWQLGLLEPPALGHAPGRLEPIADPLDLGELGSGLAGSAITPLAAARLAAACAEGELVRPYWIARVHDSEGRPLPVPGRELPRPAWPPHIARELREGMVAVTERGTARRAFQDAHGEPRLGPVEVAGKTGTLDGTEPEGRYQWFIGLAPAEAPRIAIATLVVNEPGSGSSAAQVAAATLGLVFCENGRCSARLGARLHDRAAARDAEAERELREAELAAAVDLDEMPRPLGDSGFEFPHRLLEREVSGEIVLLVDLNRQGEVLDARIDSSDLPDFDEFVLGQVKHWRFTPPRQQGRPVNARARLPIPIRIH